MNLADLSIRRPIFITCIVLVMLVVGMSSMSKLGIDLFPDVTFPVVTVTIPYPGAGPTEIETLISKPVEDEISTIAGIKRLSSNNIEGVSQVIAEFRLETDIKYAEQQIRDKVSAAKVKLPTDAKEPIIRRIDLSDQPVLSLSLNAELPEGKLYDLANEVLRPKFEQIPDVGLVEVTGGRKREIHVSLDRDKLRARELSAGGVAAALAAAGENVPSGKVNEGKQETIFRSLGEFRSIKEIERTMLNLFGNEVPTTIADVGTVTDTLEDETSRVFVNGKKSLFLNIYRQSGSNTIAVVDAVKRNLTTVNEQIKNDDGKPSLEIVRDGGKWIRDNVDDVKETIMLGIILTIVVVYFFLTNFRSTLITGLALPNSLIGAFILMAMAGFTINIVTLLALSLAVGLLIDDAIVVRENIFRHIEMGEDPITAARKGTAEVRQAVVATTLVVIAVFGPVAFMKGFTGQFFRQFGLTVCFAMAISLFDALTIAPMLSAYFAGDVHGTKKPGFFGRLIGSLTRPFERFQNYLEVLYERVLRFTLRRPIVVMLTSVFIFVLSVFSLGRVPKTFMPPQDAGEFQVAMDLPPGTSLDAMQATSQKADEIIRSNKEVALSALTVGGRNGEANKADFYVRLVPSKERSVSTTVVKERLREQLKTVAEANPKVKDYDPSGGGNRPFMLNIVGNDQQQLEKIAADAFARLSKHPGLKDVDTSFRPGKPEFQVSLIPEKVRFFGISSRSLGEELRAQVEGVTPSKFRELGREYDIRVRMMPEQRNIRDNYAQIFVPNINRKLVRLGDVATAKPATGPANINRQDRGRFIQITGDIATGAGLGDVLNDVAKMFQTDVKLPPGMRYALIGDSENFAEFAVAMGLAIGFSILFIFLVLSSLYESFVTPLTIMLALPLAMCGAFLALSITNQSINLFSMIGVIMLLGVASKNSILLVDYAKQLIEEGMDRPSALIKAGTTRLRPILMTTMALIAGTLPTALGLNEASKQRTSMGIAIVGGLISSTLLTLVVVPAAFSYIDRFRIWSKGLLSRLFQGKRPSAINDEAPLADMPHGQPARARAAGDDAHL
jgi:HAE1 family hydrophobic/amphiphilic exporter-1